MNLNVNTILLAMFPSNSMDVITLVVDKYMFYVFLIIIICSLIVNMFFFTVCILKKKKHIVHRTTGKYSLMITMILETCNIVSDWE